MAYAATGLRKIQIGEQSVFGTPVAATDVLAGLTYDIARHDREFHRVEQDRGSLDRDYGEMFAIAKMLEGSLSGPVNSQQILWFLHNAIVGNISPTQPDGVNEPNTYQWVFTPDMTGATMIDYMTLEWGENVQQKQGADMFIRTLTIAGDASGEVTISADFTVAGATDNAFTAALTAPTTHQYFATNNAKFYVDSSWATLGTTQKSCSLMNFSWELETGLAARHSVNGSLPYCGVNLGTKSVNLSLSMFVDSTEFIARETKYDTDGVDFVRLELIGFNELDSGQGNPPKIILDQAIRYDELAAPSDEDGQQVVEFSAHSVYDATSSENFEVTVLNALSSL